ncbi:Nicotinate dehydrogenase medium molybdopterin subunit [bioreactor metagenome]|uniref:Nicotinate dehydrogenase medium molybdopterin subunit n=1 Tax=bioreactor metagenome TaxID=1076179 RepID=A0A645EAI6_9ZZZZ
MDFDSEGRLTNPHFFKYHLPTYKEAPEMDIDFVETPDSIGPFGARGIGEHSVIGPAPAILNAIYDAVGVEFCEIPVTPEIMKKALENKAR